MNLTDQEQYYKGSLIITPLPRRLSHKDLFIDHPGAMMISDHTDHDIQTIMKEEITPWRPKIRLTD